MNLRTATQIRQDFVDFFVAKCGHVFVPSSSCIPHGDPTLMFTNAGMNQFKPLFLGTADPNSAFGRLKRVANSQKCIRAGGKHNDLDDVGHDTYHHTFFEMLGNWSFGDYFKKESIAWAWELLTKIWGIDPNRLHATYFQGDPAEGLEPDSEARDLWRQILPAERVHPGNKKDNFWEMGDTGPCGPCSEIHIDMTPDCSGAKLVNAGDARVMEIWNLVFIQFNRGPDGKLSPLPAKHVDTGMGFERVCAVIRGTETNRLGQVSNYDTDVFKPIFDAIQKVTGAPAYTALLEDSNHPQAASRKPQVYKDIAYRVVADHVRTLTFALTDGATPSNEGRGYVLRRILRRAVRYGRQYLGTSKPFMCDLVPAVVTAMASAFPELRTGPDPKKPRDNTAHVAAILRDEEASFIKTLDRGIALFEEAADYASKHHHGKISGEDAFKLHDTYGFPIDLTELMAEERGLTIDIGEYERLMEEAREKARGRANDDVSALDNADVLHSIVNLTSATSFSGYDNGSLSTHIEFVGVGENFANSSVMHAGETGMLILEKTPFYVEQGGQVSDTGTIESPDKTWCFEVTRLERKQNRVIHIGKCVVGDIRPRSTGIAFPAGNATASQVKQALDSIHKMPSYSGNAIARINERRRGEIANNHTSTHVLNWALREVLGDHVQQKGSLVDPDKTRFDFSHPAALTAAELAKIETHVNNQIAADLTVYAKEVPQAAALKINGLRAVFGEKYPDIVRVVSIGAEIGDVDQPNPNTLLGNPSADKWRAFSVEFCGGTHLKSTADAKRFRLVEESAVAKGVRRVVGITGDKAAAADRAAADLAARLSALASRFADHEKTSGATPAGASPAGATPAGALDSLVDAVTEFAAALSTAELPIVEKMRLRDQLAELQDHVKKIKKDQAKSAAGDITARTDDLLAGATKVGTTTFVCADLGDASADALRVAADSLRAKAGSAAVFLAARDGGRVILLAAMTPDVVGKGAKAGDLIKEMSPIVGGKGGGRPDLAQGGGTDAGKIGDAVTAALAWLRSRLA